MWITLKYYDSVPLLCETVRTSPCFYFTLHMQNYVYLIVAISIFINFSSMPVTWRGLKKYVSSVLVNECVHTYSRVCQHNTSMCYSDTLNNIFLFKSCFKLHLYKQTINNSIYY